MLQVDNCGINHGLVRVRLILPLNVSIRLGRTIRVSHVDVFTVKFRCDKLLGHYRTCAMINHHGFPCPHE